METTKMAYAMVSAGIIVFLVLVLMPGLQDHWRGIQALAERPLLIALFPYMWVGVGILGVVFLWRRR